MELATSYVGARHADINVWSISCTASIDNHQHAIRPVSLAADHCE
jgi:hypothetical protein